MIPCRMSVLRLHLSVWGAGRKDFVMSYVIMTDDQWVEKLKELARTPSVYKNWFPYNLLFWDGQRFSADCSNLEKALFNGRDIHDRTAGSYAWPLTATGDCTEYALLMQCADVSTDFGKLKAGEPRILYKDGHIGAYLGEEWNEPGQGIVNCVESTPAWEDGIQFSYVDKTGRRFWCKGGSQGASWTHHGLASKWVQYTDGKTQAAVQESISSVEESAKGTHYGTTDLAVQIIRGKFGNGAARTANLKSLGYSDQEIRSAQDLVNSTVKKANEEKAQAEQKLAIVTAAYDTIAGKYGDGNARKTALVSEFGEEGYALIQAKVNELLE